MSTPNTQWTYVIVDMEDGSTVGTNDKKTALEFAQNDQCFVISMPTCQIMTAKLDEEGGDVVEDYDNIMEQQVYKL